jgi:transposase
MAGCAEPTSVFTRRCARPKDATGIPAQPSSTASQVVKTTPVGGPERGYDGAKRLAGRKRHILVDTGGLVLAARVHGADLPDRDGGRRLLEDGKELPRMGLLWADGAYTGGFREWLRRRLGWPLEVPHLTPTGSCGATVWRKSHVAFRCCLAVGSWREPSRGWACHEGSARTTRGCPKPRRR